MTWTIQPLFPKPLASSKINEEVCDILCDDVQDYEFTLDIEETGTEGGITTNKHVLHNKPALLDYFTRKVRECMCRLGYHCDIQITTSWYTVTFPGGYSAEHAHCNSWYSAVVYFADYDDDSSQIQFVNLLVVSTCIQQTIMIITVVMLRCCLREVTSYSSLVM